MGLLCSRCQLALDDRSNAFVLRSKDIYMNITKYNNFVMQMHGSVIVFDDANL